MYNTFTKIIKDTYVTCAPWQRASVHLLVEVWRDRVMWEGQGGGVGWDTDVHPPAAVTCCPHLVLTTQIPAVPIHGVFWTCTVIITTHVELVAIRRENHLPIDLIIPPNIKTNRKTWPSTNRTIVTYIDVLSLCTDVAEYMKFSTTCMNLNELKTTLHRHTIGHSNSYTRAIC